MQFSSYSNFDKKPFKQHPENEFVLVSKSSEWVSRYLDENWELCALARSDGEGGLFWAVGLPHHLAQVFGGFDATS